MVVEANSIDFLRDSWMSTWDLIGLRVIGRPRGLGYVRHNLWAEGPVCAVVFLCFYVSKINAKI